MNILLIWPPNPESCLLVEDFTCCEPLGLEYIASSLLDEFSVDIIDMRFDRDIIRILESKDYHIIGLSIPYTTSVNTCNRLLRIIKNFNNRIQIIIGGCHPSISLKHIRLRYVDYIVIGEGVQSSLELLMAIRENRSPADIKGIAIVKDGKVNFTDKRILLTLDDYHIPARNLTAKYRTRYIHAHYKPVSLVRFSFGCPYNCSFCILWKLSNRRYITRSNDFIIQELNEIDCKNIYVVDDEAFINSSKMHKLAQQLISNNINKKYHMYIRSDTVVRNPRLMEIWAEAGLDSVLIGLESVFDDELVHYRKKISLDIAHQSLKILHNNNIQVRANFIVKPDYSEQHFEKLKDCVFDLDIDRPTFSVLTPFYGSDEYNKVKSQFIIDNPEFFDCFHTFIQTRLSLKEFYRRFAELFRAARDRCPQGNNEKVFYSGTGSSFETMMAKIESSYKYY